MKYTISTENGSGMRYTTKEDFLKEIGLMIDDCITNGGTQFDIEVYSDASCFYIDDDDKDVESIEKCEFRDTTNSIYDDYYETEAYYCKQCKRYVTKYECIEDGGCHYINKEE